MAGDFDRYFLRFGTGCDRKLRRLTYPERWCFVTGVLETAADSPIRGALLVARNEPATAEDIAKASDVTVAVAKSALKKLERLEIVVHDEELDCLVVAAFADHQPTKRHDPTAAERAKRYRERRHASRDENVTDHVIRHVANAGEGEGEERNVGSGTNGAVSPSTSPVHTRRERAPKESLPAVNRKRVTPEEWAMAEQIVHEFNMAAGSAFTLQANFTPIIGRIREKPGLTIEQHRRVIDAALLDPWWKGKPGLNVVYGNAGQFERCLENLRPATPRPTVDRTAERVAAMQGAG